MVLDEADENAQWALHGRSWKPSSMAMPNPVRPCLFSGDLAQSIRAIAERHLRAPKHVKIQSKNPDVTAIEQAHLLVHADQKTSAVLSLLEVEDFDALWINVRCAPSRPTPGPGQCPWRLKATKLPRLFTVTSPERSASGILSPMCTYWPYRLSRGSRRSCVAVWSLPARARMLQVIERVTGQKVAESLPNAQAILDARSRKLTNSLDPVGWLHAESIHGALVEV
ncbi:hypothetical protein FQR65_LT20113 [Abscondita terminalis]|nr:hypothetical protein FQR65_LT20113 [Abscondita terminalis]